MEKVEKYLKEFKTESINWFAKLTWLEPRYKYFISFFDKKKLNDAEWIDFQEMASNLHCFSTNPLAKANAFGRPNDSIENYRRNFEYLIRGEDPINVRLNNLNDKKSNYKIKYVSDSALSELIGYAYPNDYTFYNSRSKKALHFLDIKLHSIKSAPFGDLFISYNQSIKPVIDKYELIVGKKTTTTIPLEVDQFFSWLYDTKIKPTEEKYDFFPILKKFIDQAQTDNQKYSSYPKTYKELELDVKFGQGGLSHIPYLALLKNPNKVPDGIYPVYLYYKKDNILILSYGISETNTTNKLWPKSNQLQTIETWYLNEFDEKPYRYGTSFVKTVYSITDELDPETIQNDLNEILKVYNQINFNPTSMLHEQENKIFNYKSFHAKTKEAGLQFTEKIVSRFVASLCTKPFVICSGLSGSGKTKLAQSFVKWICKREEQYKIVPVGADWTNRESLLGYPNALKPEEYVKPDSGVLDLIIHANLQPDLPHFLILDEMNLSHVERYFADFLSVMESKEEIPLYAEGTAQNGVPAKLKVPSNLFIIGTVNIDETTNMFSPKVLDRANTIEFSVTQDEMKNFLGNIRDINMDALTAKGAGMAKSFLEMAASKEFATADIAEINVALVQFFGELKKTGAEFGYRSASEILRLIHQLSVLDNTLRTHQKIDIAIIQKLLPKLHGSRRKLCPILETLGSFCITGNVSIIKDVFEKADFDYNDANVLYPLSLEKIARMYRGAIDNGFASFAEA